MIWETDLFRIPDYFFKQNETKKQPYILDTNPFARNFISLIAVHIFASVYGRYAYLN